MIAHVSRFSTDYRSSNKKYSISNYYYYRRNVWKNCASYSLKLPNRKQVCKPFNILIAHRTMTISHRRSKRTPHRRDSRCF